MESWISQKEEECSNNKYVAKKRIFLLSLILLKDNFNSKQCGVFNIHYTDLLLLKL